jgi:hypothetical protein
MPGTDQIPNDLLKSCSDILAPSLATLFEATFQLNYMPDAWKDTRTIALRKPGKPDYTIANAYRPVELASTIRRLFGSLVWREILVNSEIHNILPKAQFGGRPGRSTTQALHLIVKTIKDAWKNGKHVGILSLDVKGAFPHDQVKRLAHDMRKAGIPKEWTSFYERLNSRKTTIMVDDFESELREIGREIGGGIVQGDASSMAYIFYNRDFDEVPLKGSTTEGSTGFINNIEFWKICDRREDVVPKLQEMWE